MGQQTLNELQEKVSTCDLSIEVANGKEVQVIYSDQKAAHECYFATVKEVDKAEGRI